MSDRYTDDQIERMRDAAAALRKLIADRTLLDFLIGKILFLEDAIVREGKAREADRKAAEAAAAPVLSEGEGPPPEPAPEPPPAPRSEPSEAPSDPAPDTEKNTASE